VADTAAIVAGGCCRGLTLPAVPPNILLVVLDALRRDAAEPYGAPAGSTPAIGELATRGAALRQAYATSSWTLPSHASMFTGLLPRQLGLGQAPDGSPQSAATVLRRVGGHMVPAVLSHSGYATAGWSTNLWVSQHAGFDQGFEQFTYVPSPRLERRTALLGEGPRARLAWAMEGLSARRDDGAADVGNGLRASIAAWSGQPTFWFVNLCECHSPYLPPRPWDDLGGAERVQAALDSQRHLNFESICLFAAGRWEIPAEAFERMRHLYARAAAYMDSWLADALEALDRRGILDQTLVIVTSDHGESFGEAGLIAHGFSLDQRLIHVPLVMAGPGAVSRPGPFSQAELPELMCEAAGVHAHPWAERGLPQMVAISQYDPVGSADHPRIREFAQRWKLDSAAVGHLTARFTAATDGRHKLIARDGVEQLFDLEHDPDERAPLDPGSANGAFASLRQALEHPAVAASLPKGGGPQPPGGGPQPTAPPTASDEELAALERQMKLLGYM